MDGPITLICLKIIKEFLMIYTINKSNYHNFDVFQDNKLAARSYFVPFSDKNRADGASMLYKRYESDKCQCLNGKWAFSYFANPAAIPDCIDFAELTDSIDVPSCWQFRGYEKPFYLNTRYQFPYKPPFIPTTEPVGKTFSWLGVDVLPGNPFKKPRDFYNSVGIYGRHIEIEDLSKDYIISFLGVASCLDLYVNGQYIGYSEGSHNVAEFNITSFICRGVNELLVVVHKFCNGSYLEAQDMFRNNGIFRDVLLYTLDRTDIWDIDFKCTKNGNRYDAFVTVFTTGQIDVRIDLNGENVDCNMLVKSELVEGRYCAKAVFEGLCPKEWNDRNPNLYSLYVQIDGVTTVKTNVGFKSVEIKGDLFLVNGKKIKFHGVNHHDTSAKNGYYMSPEEIEKDILLCKEFNIDTIRTSHYPPDPLLLELADYYGIYIVDEADLETHGSYTMALPFSFNRISNDAGWMPRYVDRIDRLYQRDKLHCSITMYSLGNESGAGVCTDAEADYLHERTDIPVHYESCVHDARKAYDVASQMYPSVAAVQKVGSKTHGTRKFCDRPYFLCEYAHAMGVGPGNIDDYWKEIYKYDNLIGGCVWEMVDHAVLHDDGSYTYGGDHEEWMHDGNFCVDGIFYPDRSPSTGADIVKHCYRPLRFCNVEGNTFEIFNTTAFSSADEYIIEVDLLGIGLFSIELNTKPLEKERFTVDVRMADAVTFHVYDKRDRRLCSKEQIWIKKPAAINSAGLISDSIDKMYEPDTNSLIVGDIRISLPKTILYRAATDNDVDPLGNKLMPRFYNQKERIVLISQEEKKLIVKSRITISKMIYTCTDIYEKTNEGILVTSKLHSNLAFGSLPRFGKTFILDKDFDDIEYLGRTGESYCDMKEQYIISKVNAKLSDMTEPNIRPQESGNRCDCSYVKLSNGQKEVMLMAVDKVFELGIKPYSDQELIKMKHREDEICSGVYVTVQAFQMGIGTGSCGPMVNQRFKYKATDDYEFKFLICNALLTEQ